VLVVALLVVGVAGALVRPWGAPAWAAPTVAALVALASGAATHPLSRLHPLAAPIGFLLVAVPLAGLLDRVGFFEAAAGLVKDPRNLARDLWVLGALVTTILNLDAAVVLLTPLYVRLARRRGLDPLALGFQPVLLSGLASSALPVSNLTNLIAASTLHLSVSAFVVHLGPPSLAATVVGWFAYKHVFPPGVPSAAPWSLDRRALGIGGAVVVLVLVGFVAGPGVGVPEWVTALIADLILVAATRRFPRKDIPFGTALLAGSLGLLATSAASHLGIGSLLRGGAVTTALVAGAGANLVNNLPALLVALHSTTDIWAVLVGVNVAPLLVLTGTLAALLWQSSMARLGIEVSARRFSRVGIAIVLPGFAAALATLVLLRPAVGG
jgi:arsenical pump membrane protein